MLSNSSLTIFACLLTGLVSTPHCLSMCGGISTILSLGTKENTTHNELIYASFYNIGRIFSYCMIGLLVGVLSQTVFTNFLADKGHITLQLISSVLLIIIAIFILGWLPKWQLLESIGKILWQYIQQIGKLLLPIDSYSKALLFGMIWGWLPCGLVYSILILSTTAETSLNSLFYMLAFGIGTLPGMLTMSVFGKFFKSILKFKGMKYICAFFLIVIALIAPITHFSYQSESHNHHLMN